MDLEALNTPQGAMICIVLVAAAVALLFNFKQWEAHWKTWAIDTANAMSKAGLIHGPKLLNSLAVGDLKGAFQEVKTLKDIFTDPKQRAAEFAQVFDEMLEDALADPVQATNIKKLATDALAGASSDTLKADAAAVVSASPLAAITAPPDLASALLPHLATLVKSPQAATLASVLQGAGLSNLIPAVLAGHAAAQPTTATQPTSPAPTTATNNPAPTTAA